MKGIPPWGTPAHPTPLGGYTFLRNEHVLVHGDAQMWEIDFVEKLKNILLGREWQTISVYKSKNEVLVYIDGRQELKMPIEAEEGAENE